MIFIHFIHDNLSISIITRTGVVILNLKNICFWHEFLKFFSNFYKLLKYHQKFIFWVKFYQDFKIIAIKIFFNEYFIN